MATVVLTIGGSGYAGVLSLRIIQSISNYSREFYAELSDPSRAKFDAISQNDDVQISINGTSVFRGIVEKKRRTENKKLVLQGRDYYHKLISKYAQLKSYTSQTASQIISDLVTSYFSGIFTTAGIQPTSNLYTISYRFTSINQVISELNRAEGYITYVDFSNDIHFEAENYSDSGVHFTQGQILDTEYEQRSSEIVNRVVLIYGASLDTAVERENADSIDIYGVREQVETKTGITTETDAIAYADSILNAYSVPTEPVQVKIKLDETIQVGTIVWLPLGVAGKLELPYLVLEVEHNLAPPYSTLKLGVYTSDTVTALSEIIRKLRQIEEDKISDSVTFTAINDVLSEISISGTVTVKRRTIAGALVGEFLPGQKRVGQLSGAYSTLINDSAIVTNKGIESLLRIIFQLGSIPSLYDSGNAHVSIGTGSATAKITDISLQTESARLSVDSGYPNISAGDGKLTWKATFGDGEVVTLTATEFGLLNSNSGGELILKYSGTGISKAADEELVISFEMTLAGLSTAALNLLRDMLAGFDVNYADSSNAAIEVQGTTTYRELLNSLEFVNTNYDEILAQIRITNAELAAGSNITSIKLYNKTTGGTEITTNTVSITKETSKDNVIRQKIKVKRS